MAEPMYRQIADDLRGKIDSGEIAHGAQLPTEIELMDEYSASRNTVRDAIKLLTTRGLVETRPGQGTFVVEKINPFVTTLTGDPESGQGGGEGRIYIAEVEAGGGAPPCPTLGWRSSGRTRPSPTRSGSRKGTRSSAAISSASSTASPCRSRPPSIP